MGFMPVLSTFARLFWAVVIFLAGWNKEIQIYIKKHLEDIYLMFKLSKKMVSE